MKAVTDIPERSSGTGLADFLQLLFSPSFPLVLVSLCGVSYLLASWLAAPELGLWALVAMRAIRYALFETWAAIGLGLLVIAALPLAWLAFRQRKARPTKAIGEWAFAAIIVAVLFGLPAVWPYDAGDRQVFAYSFLLFIGWNSVIQALLSTLAVIVRSRAVRGAATTEPTGA
jgi:hypothetical protein